MADIRIVPALGAINVTGSADFRGDSASTVLYVSGSGNVGVGTSNPISKFHVAGAVKATATTGHVLGTSTDTGRALSILNSGLAHAQDYAITLGYANSNHNQGEITYHLVATGSTSNRISLGLYNSPYTLNVLGNERVGVGTTGPSSKFHIYGSSNDIGTRMTNTAASKTFMSYVDTSGNYIVYDATADDNRFTIYSAGNGFFSGNVGIGITNPAYKLDVIGIQKLGSTSISQGLLNIVATTTGTSDIFFSDNVDNRGVIRYDHTNDYMSLWSAGSERVRVLSDGNVGIGTTSPATSLDVNGTISVGGSPIASFSGNYNRILRPNGTVGIYLGNATDAGNYYDNTTHYFRSSGGSSTYAVINNLGNVGIGTTNPDQKLTVYGNTLITGSLTIGATTLGANENTLVLGPPPAGGTGEGGQLLLQATGGTYTSASMWDNYQNLTRLLRGTNAGSDALVAVWNMHTKQMVLPAYTSTSAFSGTVAGLLAFDSSGNIITTPNSAGGTVNSGTAGYIAYYPSSGTTIDDTLGLYWDSSNSRVGISTSSPSYKLDVTGDIRATGAIYANANGAMYFQGGDDVALYDINISNHLGVYGVQDSTVASIKLGSGGGVISGKGGNVGIGTTNPGYKLDVVSSDNVIARFNGSAIAASSATEIDILGPQSNGDLNLGVGGSTFTDSTNNIQNKGFITAGSGLSGLNLRSDAGYVQITAGGVAASYEVARFTASGNVGIGTNSPSAKLSISGSNDNFGTGVLELIANGSNLKLGGTGAVSWIQSHNSQPLYINKLGNNVIFNVDGGSVGIGVTNPTYALDIYSTSAASARVRVLATTNYSLLQAQNGSGVLYLGVDDSSGGGFSTGAYSRLIWSSGAYPLIFAANDLERMRISSGGNVGIGSTAPGYKLDVVGDARITSDLTVNGKITAREFHTTFVSASIVYQSGSTQFGNSSDDTHIFTGNIGVGSASPAAKVDIVGTNSTLALSFGNTVPNNPLFINTYGGWSGIGMDQSTAGLRLAGDYSSGANPLVDIGYYSSATVGHANWVSRLMVLNSGNVGIGTTSPSYKLQVKSTGASGVAQFTGDQGFDGATRVYLTNDAYIYGRTNLVLTGRLDASNDGFSFGTNNRTGITFSTNLGGAQGGLGTEKYSIQLEGNSGTLYFQSSGSNAASRNGIAFTQDSYIGIGTTVPTAILHAYADSDVWHTRIGGASGELRIGGQHASGAVIQAYTPGGTVRDLYIQRDGGNIGIGNTGPTGKLHVTSGGGDGSAIFRITGTASDSFNWASSTMYANLTAGEVALHQIGKAETQYNAGHYGYRHVSDGSTSNMLTMGMFQADYLVNILATGNVGIGTSTPSNKLQVIGGVTATSFTGSLQGNITGTAASETLDTVTGRGATTSNLITITPSDVGLKVQENGTSTAWRGRLGSFNSSADKSSFLGNYTGRPGVFGHNNALSAWAELYVNTLGIYGQGNLYLSWYTYVKGDGTDTNYAIWHAGNDGAGSGLDADTLDGNHASAFLTAEADTLATVTGRGASTSTASTFSGGLTTNLLSFTAPTGDPSPLITSRVVPAGQGAASEVTELILFHSNDPNNGAGPDYITLRSPAIRLQTYNNAAVDDIDDDLGSNDRLRIEPDGTIKLSSLTSNGFVKTSGGDGTLSVDTATYIPTTDYDDFVNVTGDTMSGDLSIIGANKSYIVGEDANNVVHLQWNDAGNHGKLLTREAGTYYDNALVIKTGRIGIGNTDPSTAKLVVTSAGAAFSSTATKGGNMNGIAVVATTNENTMTGIWFASGEDQNGTHWSGIAGSRSNYTTDWSTHLAFYTHVNAASNINDTTEKMRITGEGNVGIGVTNPSSKLHVAGTIINSTSVGATGDSGIEIGTGNRLGFDESGVRSWTVKATSGNLNFSSGDGNGWYNFTGKGVIATSFTGSLQGNITGTAASETLATVTGRGATTSTQTTFTGNVVLEKSSGNNILNITSAGGGTPVIYMTNPSRGWGQFVESTDLWFKDETGNTVTMVLRAGGNVGIGSTTPAYKLDVGGTFHTGGDATFNGTNTYINSSYIYVGNNTGDLVSISGNTMYFPGDGNVGIGTTSPAFKLQVTGAIASRTLWEVTTSGMGASGTQARRYELARAYMDYNDWNSTGTIEVELRENYFSKGLLKKYVIYWGYYNSSGIHLTEMSGDGDNNFQVVIGSPVQQSGDNYYVPIYADWRYYTGGIATIRTNRTRTASAPGSTGTIYVDESPSPSNISDFTADSKVTIGYPSTNIILGPSANVGIGLTSPVSRLHVGGTNPRISIGTIEAGSNNSGVYDSDHIIVGVGGSISIGAERRGDYGLDATTATSTTFRSRVNIWSDNEDHVTFGGASTHIVTAWEDFKIWINNDSSDAGILHLYNKSGKTEFARLHGDGASWFNGGNVGIGTTSPGAKLDVNGDIFLSETGRLQGRAYPYDTTVGSGADASTAIIEAGSTAGYRSRIALAGGNATDPNTIKMFTTSAERLRITSGGNIGIGTTSPAGKLHVVGNQTILSNNGQGSLQVYNYEITTGTSVSNNQTFQMYLGRFGNGYHKLIFWSSGYGTDTGGSLEITTDWGGSTAPKITTSTGFSIGAATYTIHYVRVDYGRYDLFIKYTAGMPSGYANTINYNVISNTGAGYTQFEYAGGVSVPTLDGTNIVGHIAAFDYDTGRVGIGVTSPGHKLSVDGKIGGAVYSDSHIEFNGSGDTILKANNSVIIGYSSDTYITQGGNVGIGTTNPYEKLDVVGNIRLGNYNTVSGTRYIGYGNNTFANQFIAGMSIESTTLGGNYSQKLNFATHHYGVFAGVRMTLDERGNLGIGTTTPSYRLVVNKVSTAAPAIMVGGAYYGGPRIQTYGLDADANAWMGLGTDMGVGNYEHSIYYSAYSGLGKLTFGTYDGTTYSTKMLLNASGNLGIGTTNPRTNLHVWTGTTGNSVEAARLTGAYAATGDGPLLRFTNYLSYATNPNSGEYNLAGIRAYDFASAWGGALQFLTATTTNGGGNLIAAMTIDQTQRVGIGTTTPGAKLHVKGDAVDNVGLTVLENDYASGDVYYPALSVRNTRGNHSFGITAEFKTNTSGDSDRPSILFYGAQASHSWQVGQVTSGWGSNDNFGIGYRASNDPGTFNAWPTNYFTIKTDGNVGVGSTSPAYKLDVTGTIRATGDVIAYSDRRVKENIVTLENSLDLVTKLRGVEYNKIGETDKKIGVIAQEVLEVLPQVVQQDNDGNYSVAYGNMAGLFIEAIKQQQTHIQTLEDRISVLEQLLRQKL